MQVFIANFGRGNYEWPKCHDRNTVATMNAEAVHRFWLNGDRESYIKHCIAHKDAFGANANAARSFALVQFDDDHFGNR